MSFQLYKFPVTENSKSLPNVRFETTSPASGIKAKLVTKPFRLPPPIVWGRVSTGFRIEDLRPNRYEAVLQIIKNDYIHLDPLCTSVDLSGDALSTKNLIRQSHSMITNQSSLIVLDETKDDALVGVLVLCVVNKINFGRTFSREKLNQGYTYNKVVTLKTQLLKSVDVYVKYQCDAVLRYYLLAIKPAYRGRRLGYNLMRCGFDVAGLLRIPIAMGVFTMAGSQKIAKELGFQIEMVIGYSEMDGFHGSCVRDKSCALMIAHVPPAKISESIPPPPPEVVEKKGKKDKKKKK